MKNTTFLVISNGGIWLITHDLIYQITKPGKKSPFWHKKRLRCARDSHTRNVLLAISNTVREHFYFLKMTHKGNCFFIFLLFQHLRTSAIQLTDLYILDYLNIWRITFPEVEWSYFNILAFWNILIFLAIYWQSSDMKCQVSISYFKWRVYKLFIYALRTCNKLECHARHQVDM